MNISKKRVSLPIILFHLFFILAASQAEDHGPHNHFAKLAPAEKLKLMLSDYHFSAAKTSCDQALSGFTDGILELLRLREADVPLVSMQAHSCLFNYTNDARVQAALIEDVGFENRPGFIAATVQSIGTRRIKNRELITKFLFTLVDSPLSQERKISFLKYLETATDE